MKTLEEQASAKECNGVLAWHFLPDDRRFRYGDGSKAVVGYQYHVDLPLEICGWGLHGSGRIIDALQYAPGAQIGRVVLSGEMIVGLDKICAEKREYLWIVDATTLLHEFACDTAEKALNKRLKTGEKIDPRFFNLVHTKREWLAGLATDSDLAAARYAARYAARCAAQAAAWYATQGAAQAAARYAARCAAQAAVCGSSLADVRADNELLENRVRKLAGE